MIDFGDENREFKEYKEIKRVSIVPEYNCGGKKYLLLIKNTSRNEWETPGGRIEEGENIIQTAGRELTEEIGQDNKTFDIREIKAEDFNASLQQGLWLTYQDTRKGEHIIVSPVLARVNVDQLPTQFTLSDEHSDFMFIEIPDWGHTYRHDFISMLRQFKSQKLVLAKKSEGRIYKLRMTDDPYVIEGRKRNISKISSLALLAYLQASFDNQI